MLCRMIDSCHYKQSIIKRTERTLRLLFCNHKAAMLVDKTIFYMHTFFALICMKKGFVHNLQKVSGKSGWKVNGTRLFGSFQRKISRSNGTPEQVVLFFRTDCCKRKFEFHFFKAIFDTSFRHSLPVYGKWN